MITSEQSERSSYYQSYMGRFVDIQTALKPLKKIGEMETNFYDHFRLAYYVTCLFASAREAGALF